MGEDLDGRSSSLSLTATRQYSTNKTPTLTASSSQHQQQVHDSFAKPSGLSGRMLSAPPLTLALREVQSRLRDKYRRCRTGYAVRRQQLFPLFDPSLRRPSALPAVGAVRRVPAVPPGAWRGLGREVVQRRRWMHRLAGVVCCGSGLGLLLVGLPAAATGWCRMVYSTTKRYVRTHLGVGFARLKIGPARWQVFTDGLYKFVFFVSCAWACSFGRVDDIMFPLLFLCFTLPPEFAVFVLLLLAYIFCYFPAFCWSQGRLQQDPATGCCRCLFDNIYMCGRLMPASDYGCASFITKIIGFCSTKVSSASFMIVLINDRGSEVKYCIWCQGDRSFCDSQMSYFSLLFHSNKKYNH